MRHLATKLLVVAQWRGSQAHPPSNALLRACLTELLRIAQPQYSGMLVQALLAAADTLPVPARLPALETVAFAVRDGALQHRTRQFAKESPAISRVVFELNLDAAAQPLERNRIVRLTLVNTRQEAMVIDDRQLSSLLTRPGSEHPALLERVRSFSGARVPDLEARESWINALLTLCFAHYDLTGSQRLSLDEREWPMH